MNLEPVIEKAKIKDLKDIMKLDEKLFNYDYIFDKTLNLSWSSKNKNYYKKRILGKDSLVLIVKFENEIIGFLTATIEKGDDWRKIKRIAELESMLIESKYRGKGIGTVLIKEFFKWARLKGIKRAMVTASYENKKAIEIYKRNNFKEYDLILEADI
jgi:GNAT superfamily N-acetyltransferase